MKLFKLIFLCGAITNLRSANLTEEYYVKLVEQEMKKAFRYQFPIDNREFEHGFQATRINDFGHFDFVIIGAGSAGSVLATRLSEVSDWKILLLEAGGEENDFSKMPGMFTYSQFSKIDWGYLSMPQKNSCQGMVAQRCIIPRGKVVGGSSAINALMYVRGNKYDYDKWAELGNEGWSYEEVLPYFIKSENSQIDGDEDFHGKGGFLNVQYVSNISKTPEIVFEAFRELHILPVDYNGKHPLGVSVLNSNILHGIRQSTGTAFLEKARKRSNLKVVTNAFVTKIHIDIDTKIARAVEFVKNNKKYKARTSKEIILSAGAINSPQIMMLSGIGPKTQLQKLNIRVVHNLPAVGHNLIEHVGFIGLMARIDYSRPNQTLNDMAKDYLNGEGLFTVPFHSQSVSFISTNNSSRPNIETIFGIISSLDATIFARFLNLNNETVNTFLRYLDPNTDIHLVMSLLHPKSRGRVYLKSKNPIDFPLVDFNLLAENEDVETLLDGIETILKLLKTKTFQKLNGRLIYPEICKEFATNSRNYWKCVISHLSFNFYHPSGTLSMGQNEKLSVVNTNLEVHGIKKLRVVDASVFPSTISGHLNAPTIMIAEKVSDVIKKLYLKRS